MIATWRESTFDPKRLSERHLGLQTAKVKASISHKASVISFY